MYNGDNWCKLPDGQKWSFAILLFCFNFLGFDFICTKKELEQN